MKDIKRRVELYSLYDRSGMEEHLAKMAEKGWLLEKIGAYLWTYRRIEPKQLTFSVCYFPKASQFDPEPSEAQETFYDFCRHTGWVLAASNAQLQVFYNEGQDPVPIDTDPTQEVETVHKAMKRSFLPGQLLLLVVVLFYGWMFFSDLQKDPIGTLSNPADLFLFLCLVLLLVMTATETGTYFRWHRKAVKAAEQGEFYRTKGRQKLQMVCLALIFAGLAWYLLSLFASGSRMMRVLTILLFLIYVPGISLLVNGIKGYLKKQGTSAGVNRAVTFGGSVAIALLLIFSVTSLALYGSSHGLLREDNTVTYEYQGRVYTLQRDPAPLTLEDLLDGDFSRYTLRWQGSRSPLLGQYSANQWPIGPVELFPEMFYLDYEVILVKVPALRGLCREAKLHERDGWSGRNPVWQGYSYAPTDPTPWGAEEAYQWIPDGGADPIEDNHQYLLFYPDRVVEISLQWKQPPTKAQMAIVGEKLGRGKP